MTKSVQLSFKKANIEYKDTIFNWLDKPHIMQFWDNSLEHRNDILIFINGRKQQSMYFNGIFSYWIGLINNEPFCLIMSAEVIDDATISQIWKKNLSQTGKTISIDFCIGNENFLGKGLAASTLQEFTKFYQSTIDKSVNTFFIDPDENNPRAKYVYEQAGFISVGEFIMENGVFQGSKTYLMVKHI